MEGDRKALLAFGFNAVLAGGNAVGIRFSNRELAFLWGAGLRFSLSAMVLLAIALALRVKIPRGRDLLGSLLYGLFSFFGAFALAYYALVHLHAGFGQILLALVPLATLLLAVLQGQESLRPVAIVGALVSLVGVVVLARAPLASALPVLALLAAVGSALCFAQGAIVVRRFPGIHPVAMNAVGMAAGAVLLLAGAVLLRQPMVLPQRTATWLAVGYLVLFGSVVVFILYLVVLRYWSASRAAYVFVVIPFVTVLLSSWLDDEPIGPGLVLGGVMVLAGVYLGALRPGTRRTVPAAP